MPRPDSHNDKVRDPRRVDQPAAVVWHAQQFGGHRGVPATVITAHLRGRLALLAEQGVDECRLANAAGTEEDDRSSRAELAAQLVEPAVRPTARHQHRDAEGDLLELPTRRFRIGDEISLGEQNDGLGAAVERQHQLTLQATLIRCHGEGVTEKDDVDVRRQGMGDRAGTLERRTAHQRRTSLEHVLDPFAVR